MPSRSSSTLLALLLFGGSPAWANPPAARATYATMLKEEALKAGLPYHVADAVMAIESGYDPSKIGGVGEIGLMQVLPSTAAMMGYRGTLADLAVPATNIHYGVTYLAGAWKRADGDLCRALMKYRAGHGETAMSPLSVTYCERARAHLSALGSVLALGAAPVADRLGARPLGRGTIATNPAIRLSGAAFWAAHTARIRRIDARIERKWRTLASR